MKECPNAMCTISKPKTRVSFYENDMWEAYCDTCQVSTSSFNTEEEAIKAWDTRREVIFIENLKSYLLSRRQAYLEDVYEENDVDEHDSGYFFAFGELLSKFCGMSSKEKFDICLKIKEDILSKKDK